MPSLISKPPPALSIPPSTSNVDVSIINSTSRISDIPITVFTTPAYPGFENLDCPAFAFLITHPPTGKRYLFDLGVRKDWENLPPSLVDRIKNGGWKVTIEKDVAEILQEGGVDPKEIEGIIWSHHHWDHTGDPSTFPSSTSLIVGPGFKEAFLPGYPTNPSSGISESAYADRELREISFTDSKLKIGRCNAIDFFNDGSFYLLDTPGHAVGHMCALCRTTPGSTKTGEAPTFMFLGGDCAHHGSEFRPTSYLPLPNEIRPNPIPHAYNGSVCPGSLLASVHRLHPSPEALTEPFLMASETGAKDVEAARESVVKMSEFDASEDVFTVIAHDQSLVDVVGCFPEKMANEWKKEGWREKGMWRFLEDFGHAAGEKGKA